MGCPRSLGRFGGSAIFLPGSGAAAMDMGEGAAPDVADSDTATVTGASGMGAPTMTCDRLDEKVKDWLQSYVAMMRANLGVTSYSLVPGLYDEIVDRILEVEKYLRSSKPDTAADPARADKSSGSRSRPPAPAA